MTVQHGYAKLGEILWEIHPRYSSLSHQWMVEIVEIDTKTFERKMFIFIASVNGFEPFWLSPHFVIDLLPQITRKSPERWMPSDGSKKRILRISEMIQRDWSTSLIGSIPWDRYKEIRCVLGRGDRAPLMLKSISRRTMNAMKDPNSNFSSQYWWNLKCIECLTVQTEDWIPVTYRITLVSRDIHRLFDNQSGPNPRQKCGTNLWSWRWM
jgi:hypothetical protein